MTEFPRLCFFAEDSAGRSSGLALRDAERLWVVGFKGELPAGWIVALLLDDMADKLTGAEAALVMLRFDREEFRESESGASVGNAAGNDPLGFCDA